MKSHQVLGTGFKSKCAPKTQLISRQAYQTTYQVYYYITNLFCSTANKESREDAAISVNRLFYHTVI